MKLYFKRNLRSSTSEKTLTATKQFSLLHLLQVRNVRVEKYRGADKSLARPVRKKATAIEDFDFRISYL
jgi:hypothetical protein